MYISKSVTSILSNCLIPALLITGGCSATIPLRTAEDMDFTINRKSTITTVDNQKYLGQYVVVTPDSTSWHQTADGEKISFATREIRRIYVPNMGGATGEGLIGGPMIGGIGVFLMTQMSDCYGLECMGMIILPIGGALVGFILGPVVGANRDANYVFIHGPQDEHLVKDFKPAPPADRVR